MTIKISIIEDSEIHASWLQEKVTEGGQCLVVAVDRLGQSGIESAKTNNPDLVILDFQLPDMTGLEVARRIKAYRKKIRVFALTSHTEESIIERVIMDINIDAIAIKGSDYFESAFLKSIIEVAKGGAFIDPSLLKAIRNSGRLKGLSKLSKREFEVFVQAGSGKSDVEIARDLYVDVAHVRNLKSKISKKVKNENLDSLLQKISSNSQPI